MRIALPLAGTRGDVQPAVALGVELRGRGHDVVIGAPPNLVDFATRAGLETQACGPDVQKLYESDEGQRALASGSTFKLMPMVAKQMAEYTDRFDDEMIDVCSGADLIVSTTMTEDRGQSIAEAMSIPLVSLHTFPCRKNSKYPFPNGLPPQWSPPGPVNSATWVVAENVRRVVFMKYLNKLRAKLDLPSTRQSVAAALHRDGVPEVQIYDPVLLPGLADEWAGQRPFTGFLELTRATREAVGELADAHDDVLSWIAAGPPPIYFGFGSMPIRDATTVVAQVDDVTRRLGQRALVSAGWSDLDRANAATGDHVKIVGALAHDIVFQHCAGAVHHGGVGTLFESLRAGLPTMVCSVSFEQPMWGTQVERLGLGSHVRFTKLDAATLESGLRVLLEDATIEHARDMGAQLAKSAQACAAVADIVEAHAAKWEAK
ncbi:glycosyltransferase [Antrihabitans spumae]|uniref:Glycosyltransferase n=1 Tax=Antrihabitans spumae TaxID=3373370 RepID=A0ABW7KW32_9NOCA